MTLEGTSVVQANGLARTGENRFGDASVRASDSGVDSCDDCCCDGLNLTPLEVSQSQFNAATLVGNDSDKVQQVQQENAAPICVPLGPEHFELLRIIGQGAFGKVIQVRNRVDDQVYAMKVISKKLLRKKNHVSYMKAERDILTKIQHPFVVNLKCAFQSEKKLFLVMDYLSGGELFFHLRKCGLILEDHAKFYIGEMVLALEFLHANGIVHRDLKPENVLLTQDGHICLTDFGLAKEMSSEDDRTATLCGTTEYMAPEMLVRKGYTKAVDWWSLGALLYEMLCGDPPFHGGDEKELTRKILNERLSLPPYLTKNAHNILRGLLERNVQKRLGATKSTMFEIGGVAALKSHPFFGDMSWADLLDKKIAPPIPLNITAPEDTQYFYEEFTSQQLSPSLRLDATTPPPELQRDRSNTYEDFTYVQPGYGFTQAQLEAFEEKLEKMHRKKKKGPRKRGGKKKDDPDAGGSTTTETTDMGPLSVHDGEAELGDNDEIALDEIETTPIKSKEVQPVVVVAAAASVVLDSGVTSSFAAMTVKNEPSAPVPAAQSPATVAPATPAAQTPKAPISWAARVAATAPPTPAPVSAPAPVFAQASSGRAANAVSAKPVAKSAARAPVAPPADEWQAVGKPARKARVKRN